MFRWGLLVTIAVAVVVGGYLYFRLDDEIRRYAEGLLADHYRHLDIHVGRARFEQGRGVTIYDVTIADPDRGNSRQPMLVIDELFLACETRLEELLSAKPRIERIIVRRPYVRAAWQRDGRWNLQSLYPFPQFSDQSPPMRVEDATLVVEDITRASPVPLTIRGIDIAYTPVQPDAASRGPARLQVEGTISGSPAREVRFSGQVGRDGGSLDVVLEVRGLEVSPELLAAVPRLPERLRELQLAARADVTMRLARGATVGAPLNWSADVSLDRGRLDHQLLPQPLTGVSATLHADSDRLVTERLAAKCGTADVVLACERHGWRNDSPVGVGGAGGRLAARRPVEGRRAGVDGWPLGPVRAIGQGGRGGPAHVRRPHLAPTGRSEMSRRVADRQHEVSLPSRANRGHDPIRHHHAPTGRNCGSI